MHRCVQEVRRMQSPACHTVQKNTALVKETQQRIFLLLANFMYIFAGNNLIWQTRICHPITEEFLAIHPYHNCSQIP